MGSVTAWEALQQIQPARSHLSHVVRVSPRGGLKLGVPARSVYSFLAPCGRVAAHVAASRKGQARLAGRGLKQRGRSYGAAIPILRTSLVAALVAGVLAAGGCSSSPRCPAGASCPSIAPR